MGDNEKMFSLSEVAENNGKNGKPVWLIIKDNVYDVTGYLDDVSLIIILNSNIFCLCKLHKIFRVSYFKRYFSFYYFVFKHFNGFILINKFKRFYGNI